VKSGAPVMVTFSVVDPNGSEVALVTDAGTTTPVPPLSSFYALFDRILDPTPLEEVDADGGITPKEGVAKVAWSGGSIPVTTLYIPNGDQQFTLLPAAFGVPYNNGPSLTIKSAMGLPSGSSVTVALEPSKVRSHDQTTPFVVGQGVMMMLAFETEPLTATVAVPAPAVPEAPDGGTDDSGTDDGGTNDASSDDAGAGDGGNQGDGAAGGALSSAPGDTVVNVSFNNITSDATADAIVVTATLAGAPLAGLSPSKARDAMNPAGWTVSPPPDGWPPGAVVTVTVTTDAADTFMQTLAAPVSAMFTVMQ
jgi:hypothetical protein